MSKILLSIQKLHWSLIAFFIFSASFSVTASVNAQKTPSAQSVEIVEGFSDTYLAEVAEIRSVLPLATGGFLMAGVQDVGSRSLPVILLLDENGNTTPSIRVSLPTNVELIGGRIDKLLAVPGGYIGIGHVVESRESVRGWVVRLDSRFRTVASVTLPLLANFHPLAYFYSGLLDPSGRLVVVGRSGALSYVGSGFSFQSLPNGHAKLVSITNPGPAYRAGLLKDDVVTHINQVSILGVTQDDVRSLIAGKEGGLVTYSIVRDNKAIDNIVVPREQLKGPVVGVVAVLDPNTLDVVVQPRIVETEGYRYGIQDIIADSNNGYIATGWREFPTEDGVFDRMWTVRLDSNLNTLEQNYFGKLGGTYIGYEVLKRKNSPPLLLGTAGTTHAIAVDLIVDEVGKKNDSMVLNDSWIEGITGADTFRVGVETEDGGVVLGGTYKTEQAADRKAFVYPLQGSKAQHSPRALFETCKRSYVWDVAVSPLGQAVVVGHCVNADSEKFAAFGFTRFSPSNVGDDAGVLASKQQSDIPLSTWQQTSINEIQSSFSISETELVNIFVNSGVEGVLTLKNSNAAVLEYALVGRYAPGLMSLELEAGRYELIWQAEESVSSSLVRVTTTTDSSSNAVIASKSFDENALSAMKTLGYESAQIQESVDVPGHRNSSIRRDIVAVQIGSGLPPTGMLDEATMLHLIVKAGEFSAAKAGLAADTADEIVKSRDIINLSAANGPVSGKWLGDQFIGLGPVPYGTYAGEWRRAIDGLLVPDGYGRFDLELEGNEMRFDGQWSDGDPSGFGIQFNITTQRRNVGEFRPNFDGYGAVYSDELNLVASGIFANASGVLVREIRMQ